MSDLHAAIMNLPCKFEAAWQKPTPSDWVEGYVNGHRDTRYAAAQLVARSHPLLVEALEVVAATPNTRGVYVLDEQDMNVVRAALRKVAGEQA